MKHKKIIANTIAISASVAVISASALSAVDINDIDKNGIIDCNDLVYLKKDILQSIETEYDVLDTVSLKNQLLNENEEDTGISVTSDYSATSDNVKLVGRNLISDGTTWLVQSGSAVEFKVTGTKAVVTLAGDDCINSEEKYKPRYAVYVNDEIIDISLLDVKSKEIELFDSTKPQAATVKIIHLSEANNGAIGISNISVTSSAKNPVKPVPKKNLAIEFIGDSITCAYGVEAESQNEAFSTSTENITKSYAYLAAQHLNADYSIVGYSGHGVVSGYTSGDINTESLVPDYYDKVGKIMDYGKADWDFDSFVPDVVFINLGTNDDTYARQDYETRGPEFAEKYTEFLKTVRKKNPEAKIICTVGIMGCEDMYPYIEQAVEETGDKNISCYLSATQKMTDGFGADWHPSEKTQLQNAYIVADKICEALGIESDKIGLDAAADGVYDVYKNEEAGANAAFFVGYDKSFWVNMVEGGDKPSDIQAYIGNISLLTGKYKLEFDYNSGIDTEIPIEVADESEIIFTDTISSTSETSHYSNTFTVNKTTDNAKIIFNVGGNDYYNTTFSNITLIKIS